MKYLLDTSVFVWLVSGEKRLGKRARQIVDDVGNGLVLNVVSLFEIKIKEAVGKLEFDMSVVEDLDQVFVEVMALDATSVKSYRIFDTKNTDPFDNFLLAVAQKNKLVFLTSDKKILRTKIEGVKLVDASK